MTRHVAHLSPEDFNDADERKQTDEALRESRNLLSAFLEQLPVGAGLIDRDGRWALTNAALRAFVGTTMPSRDPEQIDRWRAWDQDGNPVPPLDWPGARALRGETVSPGMEMLYRTIDGETIWTRVRSTPLRDANGEIMGAICTVEDIDQRKRADEVLKEQEQRLRQAHAYLDLAQKAGSVGFFDHNVLSDCSGWTEGLCELYGTSLEAYDGSWEGWVKRVVAEDAQEVRRILTASVHERKDLFDCEFRAILPGGGIRWLAGRARLFYGPDGSLVRITGVNMDVTGRKRAEESLRLERERLCLALQGGQMGVYDWDMREGRLWWSPEVYELFGVDPAMCTPSPEAFTGLVHPEDRDGFWHQLQRAIDGKVTFLHEFRIVRPDGTVRWIGNRARTECDQGGRPTRHFGIAMDITERKQAEDALRERETQLAAEVKALQDLHGLTCRLMTTPDLPCAMEETLDAVLNLVGMDMGTVQVLDEPAGLKFLVYRGFDAAVIDRAAPVLPGEGSSCALALEAGERVVIEDFEADPRASGHAGVARSLGYRSAQSTPLRTRQGTLLGMLTTHGREPRRYTEHELRMIDLYAQHAAHLIEQRQAEQVQRETEARFRTMANISPVIIWVTDASGGLEFINKAYQDFCGVIEEDVRANRWNFIVHPDDRDEYVGEFLRCVRERKAFVGKCRIKRADGAWRWIASYGAPRFSSSGEFLGHVGSSPDIDELMTAQRSLQTSEERLRLAMAGGSMGAWEVDFRTGDMQWDAKQREIFGWVEQEPPRTRDQFFALVHPDDAPMVRRATADAEATGRLAEEFRIIRPDGEVRWIAGLGAAVTDQAGQPVRMVGVNYDITERRDAQARLERFAEELERQVRDRTEELEASHTRLRNLATELNLAEQRERKRLAAELHDHLQQTLVLGKIKVGQGKRTAQSHPVLGEIIRQLDEVLSEALTYTRTLVAELSPPVLRDHGLAAGLNWLAEYMKKHDLAVAVRLPEGNEIKLPEDQAGLLFQSVRELLINSSKYAGTGAATVTVDQQDGWLSLEVRDDGGGFELASVRDSQDAGTGFSSKFGLFSIGERMRALGGAFHIRSAPNQGTTATLRLPLPSPVEVTTTSAESAAPYVRRSAVRTRSPEVSNATVRVLLADDHTMVRQGLRSLLEDYSDVEVVGEASDGHEAVSAVERLGPGVVVMDINMPKKNGIEATADIKTRYPDITVIGLSVNADEDNQAAMLKVGASILLTKEAAVEHLYDAIQDCIKKQ